MRVIVNADDLGISEEVNARVFELMRVGSVTSSTLLVNAPAFQDAVRRIAEFPRCSFGVHLNATAFRPLTSDPALGPLLTPDGMFNASIRSVRFTRALRNAVRNEWAAQINHAVRSGVPVSHVDSHHHVHTIPQLFICLKAVLREFGIRKARGTMTLYPDPEHRRILLAAKHVWTAAMKHVNPTKIPDHFTGFEIFHRIASRLDPASIGSLELMTHPGSESNQAEEALLEQNWLATAFPDAERISYREL
jgi:chitin disaccharide deacetylase